MKKKALYAAVFLLLPAAMLFFSADKLHYPTAQWDGWVLQSVQAVRAGTFASAPYVIHPPLYLYALAFFQPLWHGDPLAGARLFNFGCYLLTGWLVFVLARRLAGKTEAAAAGLIGALLYFSSPLAFQGTFLLDLGDTAVVPLASAVYFCALSCGARAPWKGLPLAAAFALNLWAKFVHSLFIVLAALLEQVSGEKGGKSCANLRTLAAGFALFVLSWALYAYTCLPAEERWGPFNYFVGEMIFNYQRQDLSSGLRQLLSLRAIAVVRVLLWLWPLLLLWAGRLAKRGLGTGAERCMNYFILVFMVGAWLSKGTSNGFPKYHAALLPPLCALCAAYAAQFLPEWRRGLNVKAWLTAAAMFLLAYAAGDPIYVFSHSLKAALIRGSGMHIVAGIFVSQALAVPAILFLLWSVFRPSMERTAAAALAVLAAGLLWQSALYARQARGDYFTTYGYGTEGKKAAAAYIRANLVKGAAAGANEFAWEFKAAGVPFLEVSDKCFVDKKCALALLRDGNTAFFVFGQASNTVEQVKFFRALTPEKLGRPFYAAEIGDFWVYRLGPCTRKAK